jgi:hypothetical protein
MPSIALAPRKTCTEYSDAQSRPGGRAGAGRAAPMNKEGIGPIIDTVCNLAFCSFLDNVRSGESDRRNNLNLRQIRHRLRKSLA